MQEDESKPEVMAAAQDAAADHVQQTFDQEDSEPYRDDDDDEDEEERQHEQSELEGFPLLFFGVEGRDISDEDSPSFYNPTEAMVVRSLITKLLEMTHLGITTDQIGVIAPYRKQVSPRFA
jgi:superfamily I DNA and/or RNA helicase